jgi:hypothetical protein
MSSQELQISYSGFEGVKPIKLTWLCNPQYMQTGPQEYKHSFKWGLVKRV